MKPPVPRPPSAPVRVRQEAAWQAKGDESGWTRTKTQSEIREVRGPGHTAAGPNMGGEGERRNWGGGEPAHEPSDQPGKRSVLSPR